MEIILGIIFLVVVLAISKSTDWKYDNRQPPEGYHADWAAMNRDLARGESKNQVKSKFNRGVYDIPDDKNNSR